MMTTAKRSEDRRQLSGLVGYGDVLADALKRSGDLVQGDPQLRIYQDSLAQWMENSPHSHHLCFADITFFREDDEMSQDSAASYIFTRKGVEAGSGEGFTELYKEALRVEFFGRVNALAIHPDFQRGLRRNSDSEPNTVSPKNDEETGYFVGRANASRFSGPLVNEPIPSEEHDSLDCIGHNTYGEAGLDPEDIQSIKSQHVDKQWEAWKTVWGSEKGQRVVSPNALSPHHLIAVPVGIRDQGGKEDFLLVACLFLAYDKEVDVAQIREALRYILLYLYEANATAKLARERKVSRDRAAMGMAQHEMKNLLTHLNRWIATSEEVTKFLESEGAEDKSHLLGAIWLPEIFRAGLSYLNTWALTDTAADLPFYRGAEEQMPTTLGELVSACWNSAIEALVFTMARSYGQDRSTVQRILSFIHEVRSKLNPDLLHFEGGAVDSPICWTGRDGGLATQNVPLSRLLIHLCRESIEHGSWESLPTWHVNADDYGRVTIRVSTVVYDGKVKAGYLRELASRYSLREAISVFNKDGYSRASADRLRAKGAEVYEFLAKDSLGGTIKAHENEPGSSAFVREFVFSQTGRVIK